MIGKGIVGIALLVAIFVFPVIIIGNTIQAWRTGDYYSAVDIIVPMLIGIAWLATSIGVVLAAMGV